MRPIVIPILLLISTFFVHAQNVTNVRVYQDGEEIVIMYDLDKRASVRVLVAAGKSNQFTELRAVTGSVGKDISAGVNKQITWQPLQEQTEFVAQNVRFRVEAPPNYYFSVGATKKVAFSSGNLQYTQSTNTWSFAEHQYDMLGTDNVEGGEVRVSSTPESYFRDGDTLADKIDLFGWSGSRAIAKRGVGISTTYEDYSGDFVDWGTNIGDGKTWRTLTKAEWDYLCNGRANAANFIGVARIQLSESKYVNGLILLPDNWICPTGVVFKSGFAKENSIQAYTVHQTFSISDWLKLDAVGAVFLPVSGIRYGAVVGDVHTYGNYWSATANGSLFAHYLLFVSYGAFTDSNYRYSGQAVRLVQDYK